MAPTGLALHCERQLEAATILLVPTLGVGTHVGTLRVESLAPAVNERR